MNEAVLGPTESPVVKGERRSSRACPIDVFISYATEDSAEAIAARDLLAAGGLQTHLYDPPRRRGSDVFQLLLKRYANKSHHLG